MRVFRKLLKSTFERRIEFGKVSRSASREEVEIGNFKISKSLKNLAPKIDGNFGNESGRERGKKRNIKYGRGENDFLSSDKRMESIRSSRSTRGCLLR